MNVSNNIPMDSGSKFSSTIGKIFCPFVENNNDKSDTVYHYCFLNGKEYVFLSDQKLEITNKLFRKL